MRTDDNHNPTAFTTQIADEAFLEEGIDYTQGTPFVFDGVRYYTAKLLLDPVETTIRVIDETGFYTRSGEQRWDYIGMPKFLWTSLTPDLKRDIIGFMYQHEGGVTLRPLFPNYGTP